jgi:hypothetical protein
VLLDSVPQIARHSGVQAARPAGKNVDAVVAIHRMPQEWTKPSRETTKREDDSSAFLSFAFVLFFAFALCPCPCPCPCLCPLLDVVIPNRVVCGRPEGPAVRFCLCPFLSLRCHPERGRFCRRGTCCSILLLPTSSPSCGIRSLRRCFRSFCPPRLLLQPFPLRSATKSFPLNSRR